MINKTRLINLVLIIIFVVVVGYLLEHFGLSAISLVLKDNSLIGGILYFLFMVASVVFVALPAVPLWPLALLTLGLVPAIFVTVIGVNIGAFISFTIGRVWGRRAVERLIGKHHVSKVEHMFGLSDTKTFLLLRVLGNNAFDVISYLGGLSKLNRVSYVIITFLTSSFWISVSFFLIDKVLATHSSLVYLGTVVSYLIALGLGAILVNKIIRKRK